MARKSPPVPSDYMKEHSELQKTLNQYRHVRRLLALVRGTEPTASAKNPVIAKRNRLVGKLRGNVK